jgi:hypothetical protein
MVCYGVPKSMVGLESSSTYGEILVAKQACVGPVLAMIGHRLTTELASRFPGNIKIDFSVKDPPGVEADIQMNREVRRLRGKKPFLHGGDDLLFPGNGAAPTAV